ncbi:hypothetical protein BH11PLA2_BH11PLA2_15040 [soil metagenome]
MRDLTDWALPLGRIFGVALRLHILFPVIALPLFLRLVGISNGNPDATELFLFTVVLLFALVLVHELGHVFAARVMNGEPGPMILWPLGGLFNGPVAESPRVNLQVAFWGPLANLLVCVACALVLLAGRFSPLNAFNLVANPLQTQIANVDDGRVYTSDCAFRYYRTGTADAVTPNNVITALDGSFFVKDAPQERVERAIAPAWVVWVWRACWLSFWLAVVNIMIPAFPLDGGRMLHAVLWSRSDTRTATLTVCYVGFGAAFILMMVAFVANESFIVFLSLFLCVTSYLMIRREVDEASAATSPDYSEGYSSLENEEAPRTLPARRQSFFKRWLVARQIRRLKQEHEDAINDEVRMDELLDKIAQQGQKSLSDEERRFLERVSNRYRNRSS